MKKVLLALTCIFAVFVVGIAGFGFYMTRGLNEGQELQIGSIDVSNISDGVYNGKYNGGRWSNEVNVDAVSGATVTTKAYLKEIENALAGK